VSSRRSLAVERGAGGAPLRAASGRRAFVSLGSNLGDRAAYLGAAREALAALPATTIVAASRIYETAPQDLPDQDAFLNQVVCLETALLPLDLLRECQRIEREHGRVRELRFGPRTLDIDILLFQDAESDDPELTLPHPRMVKRAFVLVPLAEIWEHARGMPDMDVAGLGRATTRTQRVRLYDATEG
jgi:2-amino-4-hydroxy-6-hydroxymethyldihydropteridine diphosphokinase